MKKTISIILSILIISCMLPLSLNAMAEEYTEGYYTYEVIDDEASIISVNTGISTAVEVPSSLGGYPITSIGWGAFDGCTKITSLFIPASVTFISNEAFIGCTGLTGFTVDANNPVYTSIQNCLIEKDTKQLIAGCKNSVIPTDGSVTSIGYYAFYGCTGLLSITIPDCVTSIDWGAFQNCTRLKDITVHDNIEYFGGDAIDNTAYYNDSDNWEDGVLYIGNYLVKSDGYTPATYSIREGTVSILDSAFAWCEDITSITIPSSVKSIGYDAFYNCIGLTSITIPNSVTSIDYSAFQDCTNLKTINVHNNITYIGLYAFDGTAYYNNSDNWTNGVLYLGTYLLKANENVPATYTIREGTTLIADSAFAYNETITAVTIPDSVKYIGLNAFESCPKLTTATIGNGVKIIGDYTFYDCASLSNVTLGNSIEAIEQCAFSDCIGLKNITLPGSVKTIGYSAFYYCTELASINLTNRVTSIGYEAFEGCEKLTDVYFEGKEDEWTNIDVAEYNDAFLNANIHYIYTPDEPTVVFGDVDSDGAISASDALLILQYSVDKIVFTAEQTKAGNVNSDDAITASDALLVLQYSVDKIDKFPVNG